MEGILKDKLDILKHVGVLISKVQIKKAELEYFVKSSRSSGLRRWYDYTNKGQLPEDLYKETEKIIEEIKSLITDNKSLISSDIDFYGLLEHKMKKFYDQLDCSGYKGKEISKLVDSALEIELFIGRYGPSAVGLSEEDKSILKTNDENYKNSEFYKKMQVKKDEMIEDGATNSDYSIRYGNEMGNILEEIYSAVENDTLQETLSEVKTKISCLDDIYPKNIRSNDPDDKRFEDTVEKRLEIVCKFIKDYYPELGSGKKSEVKAADNAPKLGDDMEALRGKDNVPLRARTKGE